MYMRERTTGEEVKERGRERERERDRDRRRNEINTDSGAAGEKEMKVGRDS